jgi:hypothetical protein
MFGMHLVNLMGENANVRNELMRKNDRQRRDWEILQYMQCTGGGRPQTFGPRPPPQSTFPSLSYRGKPLVVPSKRPPPPPHTPTPPRTPQGLLSLDRLAEIARQRPAPRPPTPESDRKIKEDQDAAHEQMLKDARDRSDARWAGSERKMKEDRLKEKKKSGKETRDASGRMYVDLVDDDGPPVFVPPARAPAPAVGAKKKKKKKKGKK